MNSERSWENSWIRTILQEDLGPAWRDVSVLAIGQAGAKPAVGAVRCKVDAVVCGLRLFEPILREVEGVYRERFAHAWSPEIELKMRDGAAITGGTILANLRGPVGVLLTAERTLLNILQRLSAVATLTRKFVEAMKGTKCRLLDTRKTTPGMRTLEKEAVRVGGGANHRFGLFDMVMFKDNHITAMGGDIAAALREARSGLGPTLKVEVECATIEMVKQALGAGADMIMLDNMSAPMIRECVELVNGKVPLEASGGIVLGNVAEIAATGVDFISTGAVTHSAPSIDISMKIELVL